MNYKKHSTLTDNNDLDHSKRRKDQVLILFGLLFFWPLLLPIFVTISIIYYALIKNKKIKSILYHYKNSESYTSKIINFCIDFRYIFIFLPIKLVNISINNKIHTLFAGILLVSPLLVFSIMGILFPHSESIYNALLGPSPAHPLGTDGLGRDILYLLIKSSTNTYLISVIVTISSIIPGIYLGLKSMNKMYDNWIIFIIQIIESIPSLVWIIMMLTAYGYFQTSFDPEAFAHQLMDYLRPVLIGLLIGLCFMPNIFRLVRDKIKFFIEEEFVDMTRAHGIPLKRILWNHILLKNSLPDLMIIGGAIPGIAILSLINIDYFFCISTFQIGASRYSSWPQMILTSEAKNALIFFEHLWLVLPPCLLIIITTIGCYLFGTGLKIINNKNKKMGLIIKPDNQSKKILNVWGWL